MQQSCAENDAAPARPQQEASVMVVGGDAPRFGCGSAVVGVIGDTAATAFWRTDRLAADRAWTAPSAQSRQRDRDVGPLLLFAFPAVSCETVAFGGE
jgi:hypothetical protein